jgi:hypothetical protein
MLHTIFDVAESSIDAAKAEPHLIPQHIRFGTQAGRFGTQAGRFAAQTARFGTIRYNLDGNQIEKP